MQKEVMDIVLDSKIIAIVRGLSSGHVELAQALYAGGIRAIEVTLDQAHPSEWQNTITAIRDIKSAFGDKMVVGAGTVTSEMLVKLTAEAGGQFIVSPDTNIAVIHRTKELGMASFPGAMSPSEIITAHNAGADCVKVFPAGVLGPSYIKAVHAPLNHINLIAVGGINDTNLSDYLKAGCVGVGCGGNLVNKDWVQNKEFHRITELAKRYVENAKQY